MSDELPEQIIVNALIEDLCNRAGLQNIWDGMDRSVRDEIKDAWVEIVKKNMRKP